MHVIFIIKRNDCMSYTNHICLTKTQNYKMTLKTGFWCKYTDTDIYSAAHPFCSVNRDLIYIMWQIKSSFLKHKDLMLHLIDVLQGIVWSVYLLQFLLHVKKSHVWLLEFDWLQRCLASVFWLAGIP